VGDAKYAASLLPIASCTGMMTVGTWGTGTFFFCNLTGFFFFFFFPPPFEARYFPFLSFPPFSFGQSANMEAVSLSPPSFSPFFFPLALREFGRNTLTQPLSTTFLSFLFLFPFFQYEWKSKDITTPPLPSPLPRGPVKAQWTEISLPSLFTGTFLLPFRHRKLGAKVTFFPPSLSSL